MRTKTLLLSAASLLTAGLISTQAQPVYSQNVVGYANVVTLNAGSYYMLTVPFAIGVSNGANEVFGSTLPVGSSILTWNPVTQQFNTAVFDNTDPIGAGTDVVWYNGPESAAVPPPLLPVGQGFFLNPNGAVTNTFAGTIAVNVGTSNKMTLANAGSYYMVASAVPYAGAVTNGNNSTGGPNLNGLPVGTSILTWNPVTQQFSTAVFDNTDPIGAGTDQVWYNGPETAVVACPVINVGQGFFVNPNGSYTWTTGL